MAASADIVKDFQQQQSTPRAMVQAVTAVAAARSMVVLSGLTVATTLLMILSPVPVPAAVAAFLIAASFLTSGGFGLAALSVLSWMYAHLTGKRPPGADQLVSRARDAKDSSQHRIEQAAQ